MELAAVVRPMQATGRPGTPVIPPGWNDAGQAVMAGARTGLVSLAEAGTSQEWSEEEQAMVSVPSPPYAANVPARVKSLAARQVVTVGDREVTVEYVVAVDAGPVVRPGHRVELVDVDPLLDGTRLVVEHVTGGTERWSRNLYCSRSS